jgi:hypothetical protein
MASTFSDLKFELIGTGDQAGNWGQTTNDNIGTAIEQAITGLGNPNFPTDGNLTITLTDTVALQAARALVLNVTSTGSLTATRELVVPTIQKQYIVQNNTTGGRDILVKTAAGTGITVPSGEKVHLYVDGVNVISAVSYFSSLNLGTALSIANGGTGQTTRQAALDALAGSTTSGQYLRGNGTDVVMSAIQAADVPTLNQNTTGTAANVTGTVAVANGGTGATDAAGARTNLVAARSGANTDITSIALTTGTITTTPTNNTDLVNKQYADGLASGIHFHEAVAYATTAALPANTYNNGSSGVGATLTANANGALSVDSTLTVVGNRILVKNEAAGANNGVYVVTQVGSAGAPYILTRSTDMDTVGTGVDQVQEGDFFLVTGGTANINTAWVQQTAAPITIGTTALVFQQFAAPITYTAGTGLSESPSFTFNIANTGTAGTYGSASSVPVFTTNAQGQVTAVTNTAISIPNSATTATAANTANAIVARDASGNFTAGTVTAALTGNASTAATLQTARNIGGVSFNGSADINLPGVNTSGNQNTTGTAANVTGIVAVANGGTGTATPSLVQGTNITITGSWPNQTINASGGSGSGDVTGPASATDNGIALFNGTTGKIIKDAAAQDGFIYGVRVGRGAGGVLSGTAVGFDALLSNTTGADVTAVGYRALRANTIGVRNVAIGSDALRLNSSGIDNTAVGNDALGVNTTGASNVAVGRAALGSNTTGASNVAVGHLALNNNTIAIGNTAVGRSALQLNTTGINVAVGFEALRSNTTGTSNTAVGHQALTANSIATNNTAVGFSSLVANTTGNFNTAVGVNSLAVNITGSFNTAIGSFAGSSSSTADGVTAVGYQALLSNTGSSNTAVGRNALASNTTGTSNTAVGTDALLSNSTGTSLVAVGDFSLRNNTTGTSNVAVGSAALRANTIGSGNTAVGSATLDANTTGVENTAVGASALRLNTTGSNNTAMGYDAARATTVNGITAFGSNALRANTTGTSNTAVGDSALRVNTIGTGNVAVGSSALLGNTTGINSTAVGFGALSAHTTGNSNTAVGLNALNTTTTGVNNTGIGNGAVAVAATTSNSITLGNSAISSLRCQVTTITALSDARDKTNIVDIPAGLSFVQALRPVSFDWNMRDGGKIGVREFGFIAQELRDVQTVTGITVPHLVLEDNPERLEASSGTLLPIMVKAIQELKAEFDAYKLSHP